MQLSLRKKKWEEDQIRKRPAKTAVTQGSYRSVEGSSRMAGADVPGQQFFNAIDGMIGNSIEHVPQVRLWIETVQFGRADQTVHRSSALPAGIGSREQVVLAAERNSPQRALRRIIVDFKLAVLAKAY